MISKIAHVGYDRSLMKARSTVLCDAGFSVDEVYTVRDAVILSEFAHVIVICHSMTDRARLISAIRKNWEQLPIVCVTSRPAEAQPEGCLGVADEPLALLDAVTNVVPGDSQQE